MQVNHVLEKLHRERQRYQRLLGALDQAIAAFDVLNNGGHKRRGRPRRFAPEAVPERVAPMRQKAAGS